MRLIVAAAFCFVLTPSLALAFGKKRKEPAPPSVTQAYPTRVISIGRFLDTPFLLPDGKTRVDMGLLLPELARTEVTQATNKFRVSAQAGEGNGTLARFVLRGGITSFEATSTSANIRFGYKPGLGDLASGVLSGAEGTLSFAIGSLGIDFHIIDTERQEVVAVGKGSALTGNGKLEVSLDFKDIKSGADFVFNSPMSKVFRAAMRKAIDQMAKDPNTNFFMDWGATVTKVNYDLKRIFFGAGARDEIKPGNVFTLYDNASMRIGEALVYETQHDQSVAAMRDDADQRLLRSVRAGDQVKIYYSEGPK
ncbi:MAG: hypothetical protein AB1540_12600 [Bdellovibrionota bacterium]